MKRMTPQELDRTAARLEEIGLEEDALRTKLYEQIEEFGSIPARAEKSRRLISDGYQFTLTTGTTTEIKDNEVERIRQSCPSDLFKCLFRAVTKYKLADGATLLLADRLPADAPRNLRVLFHRAVETKDTAPRLRIEKLAVETSVS